MKETLRRKLKRSIAAAGPVARALIGEVYIHIFVLCPTNFFRNQLLLGLISKEISRA